VDVAAGGALAVVAAEVAADGTVVAGWVAVALDVGGKGSTLVVDPLDVVPGVHPASAAAIARNETTAANPKRAPDPDSMHGRYSRPSFAVSELYGPDEAAPSRFREALRLPAD